MTTSVNKRVIWSFTASPELEELIQNCIQASIPDETEKWLYNFRINNPSIGNIEVNYDCDNENTSETRDNPENSIPKDVDLEDELEFFKMIDSDPLTHYDLFIEKFSKSNESFCRNCAERFSIPTINKLCERILKENTLNKDFLDKFYNAFFPAYIIRDYNMCTLDILIRASKIHPTPFKQVINILMTNINIPNAILQNYIRTLNDEENTKFLITLAKEFAELPLDSFTHHIQTLFLAYKDCIKDKTIDSFIFKHLKTHAEYCKTDKHYGKLLLAFLQANNDGNSFIQDWEVMDKLINTHQTSFKRPCTKVLTEINQN